MKYKQLIRAYPQLEGLANEHLQVALKFDKLRPSWLPYARIEEFQGDEYLQIDIPSPVENRHFIVNSSRPDFTYGYYFWHSHRWFEKKPEEALRKIIEVYEQIVTEQMIVAIILHTRERRRHKTEECSMIGLYTIDDVNNMPDNMKVWTVRSRLQQRRTCQL